MLYGCYSLNSIDVTKFNTYKVEDMSFMFTYCTNAKSLDVKNFNIEKVKSMESMFQY